MPHVDSVINLLPAQKTYLSLQALWADTVRKQQKSAVVVRNMPTGRNQLIVFVEPSWVEEMKIGWADKKVYGWAILESVD